MDRRYEGPFLYDSILGQSIKPFLLLPAIIATPVLLIFNFYPRAVLRKVYAKSIDLEIKTLQKTLHDEKLSEYEQLSYVIEVEKMSRDELRRKAVESITAMTMESSLRLQKTANRIPTITDSASSSFWRQGGIE
jgi:hypothetical protein